jgi:hypothetical protein
MILGNLVHTSTVLIRRSVASEAGLFREDYQKGGEDYDYYLRICKLTKVAFVDQVCISYEIGDAQALTRPANRLKMAESFLETHQRMVAENSDTITLPKRLLTECLADAYAWAGRESLVAGNPTLARSFLKIALEKDPLQIDAAKYWAASFLPLPFLKGMRSIFRR